MTDTTDGIDWYDPDLERYNCWEEHRMTSKTTWMLKNKTVINISDMTSTHIKNAMALLEKIDWRDCAAYQGLYQELQKRT